MQSSFPYRLREQQLWLSPDRSVFWEEEKSLIISDLHFGKTGHFRKSGIAVPQSVYKEDLQRLVTQIQYFQPRQLIIAGDLFHSRENKELDWFKKWRDDFPDLIIQLIKGNHDVLKDSWYADAGITVTSQRYTSNNFHFIHDITHLSGEDAVAAHYFFSGHIHPGIKINGNGRQSLYFPCFYFGEQYAVLPAFSRFTGLASIRPKTNENVFAIVENKIVQLM
jgi:DNA ligase-associated metallophosphoesterase